MKTICCPIGKTGKGEEKTLNIAIILAIFSLLLAVVNILKHGDTIDIFFMLAILIIALTYILT